MTTCVITGGNAGCGYEACRQLATIPEVGKIILTARSKAKADNAIDNLVKATGVGKDKFDSVVLDLEDLASVVACIDALPFGIDRLCLNAGGGYDGFHIGALVNMTYVHTLAHEILTEGLLKAKKVSDGGRILYVTTELIRPIVGFTGLSPGSPGWYFWDAPNPDHFESYMSSQHKNLCPCLPVSGQIQNYARGKLLGSLYFGQLAKEHPELFIVSISPGAIASAVSSGFANEMKFPVKQLMTLCPSAFVCMRLAHDIEAGTSRYTKAMTGDTAPFNTGAVILSGRDGCPCHWGARGDPTDNAKSFAYLADEKLYEAAAKVQRKKQAEWLASLAPAAEAKMRR